MHSVHIAHHNFVLLPQRALYWPSKRMLLVADLHLGKADVFRHHGIAIPHRIQQHDLSKLDEVLRHTHARKLVILGDFVHGPTVSKSTCDLWNTLVKAHSEVRFELVLGNHDRNFPANQLHLHAISAVSYQGDVALSHEPLSATDLGHTHNLNIHGHIHPAVAVPGTRRKLPAMVYSSPHLNLPAFSEFTAGVAVVGNSQTIWAIAEDENVVVQIQ